jgi:uncharacterized protein YifN (PemK superfamily)
MILLLENYYPKAGQVLTCDFCTGFMEPEMIKERPVIVVSPTSTHGRRLCTVVPLSTTAPNPVKAWHLELPQLKIPNWPTEDGESNWAKCDMLMTVGFARLDRPHTRTPHGRKYFTVSVAIADLADVLGGVRAYLRL